MRIYLFLILLLTTNIVIGQSKGKVLGTVFAQNAEPLEKATVTIFNSKDSSVVSYLLTDTKGKFEFVKIPTGTALTLFISHVNANPFRKEFSIPNGENYDFAQLKLDSKSLDEVVVNIVPPVRMNKDTLEYNTNFFKTRPNANVEELLKELPGLQVNMDGSIYYQGKEVSKVRVNDKDFFSSDVRIATRNLDASLIKTVQVYRDKGETKKDNEDEDKLPITINLKFKKDFLKASFGKLYGSAGTRSRYEAGGLFNSFKDTLQLSFLGFGNNINRQSFDYNELNQEAGLGRAENYGFENFGGRNYSGKANDIGLGFNLNNDWGKKTKLNIMYMLKYNKAENQNTGNQISLYDQEKQYSASDYQRQEKSVGHNLKTLLRHRMDTTAYFEFTPNLGINSKNNSTFGMNRSYTDLKKLNDATGTGGNKENTLNYSHGFYIEKQLNKNHIVSFRNTISINTNEKTDTSFQNTNIYDTAKPRTSLWYKNRTQNNSNNLYFSAAYYNKIIKKLNFDYYFTYVTNRQGPQESVYINRDSTGEMHAAPYENSYRYKYQDYITGIIFYWRPTKDFNVKFGTAYQVKVNHFDLLKINSVEKSSLGYWLPNINIRYKDLNLGWYKDLESPELYGIQQLVMDLNPLYTRKTSFIFNNIEKQNVSISYYKYTSKLQFNVNGNINYVNNSIGSRSWRNNNTGQMTTQMFLAGSKYNYSTYTYLRYNLKASKNWSFYLSQNNSIYTYENYSSVNDVDNKGTNIGINASQQFSATWKNLVTISPQYTYSWNKNINSVKDNPDFIESTYSIRKIGAGLNINPIHGFSLESTYSLDNRASGLSGRKNYHILNASVYYTFKNNSQLKLTGFDILNQNTQNYWGSQGNVTYFGNSLTLKQYFMLGYIHKFNIIKTKK
ncbi:MULTISPECIES: carboxypeptidase-like regulatory domain-containing protein [unclassified Sphingobacterium]|uniref:carboxypeptidase-like regulatory domain-containing protein n=1 Tax=unclassified Sphingobacterium TaxID=2609468 RepID=UPI002954CFC3|nr:carboxypeptidase-like regulatory domain-containing protein [Sphingobacterium sp. UGAL515B_05]WON95338.1 carboxypeptidase-like regulatory domain-containing protein [Sphingobacterium sp. UGAL515B_05]